MAPFEREILSHREKETVALAAEGLTDKEIAAKFNVSRATIRTYWERIRTKTGASNRASAVATIVANHLQSVNPVQDQKRKDEIFASAVAGAIVGGIIVLDRAHRIQYANDAAYRLLNHPKGSLDGVSVTEIIPSRYGAFHDTLAGIETGMICETCSLLTFARVVTGRDLLVRISIRNVNSDGTNITVLLLQDAIADLDARRRGIRYHAATSERFSAGIAS